jgi:hypothetical protein
VSHPDSAAIRSARALRAAQAALATIRLLAKNGTAPAWATVTDIIERAEGEIDRIMKEPQE